MAGVFKAEEDCLKKARLILENHFIELEPERWFKTDPSQESIGEWRRMEENGM